MNFRPPSPEPANADVPATVLRPSTASPATQIAINAPESNAPNCKPN